MGIDVAIGVGILLAGAFAVGGGFDKNKNKAPDAGKPPVVPTPEKSLEDAQANSAARRRQAMAAGGNTLGTGSAQGAILQQSETYKKTLLGG